MEFATKAISRIYIYGSPVFTDWSSRAKKRLRGLLERVWTGYFGGALFLACFWVIIDYLQRVYHIPHQYIIFFLLQTASMDILHSKLQLLKDVSQEHRGTIVSVRTVRDNLETLTDHLEKEIATRAQEKGQFKTKIGLHLRQNVLDLFNRLIAPIHDAYCTAQEIYTQLIQRQVSLEEVIKHGQPILKEIQHLSHFIQQTSQRYATTASALSCEEKHPGIVKSFMQAQLHQQNKENRRTENSETKTSRRQQGDKYKMNMLLIAREGSQNFIKASQRLKKFQIMELSLVIDECITFISDHQFIKGKSVVSRTEKHPEGNTVPQHGISLGIESVHGRAQDIDLLCDQEISFALPMPKKSVSQDLQRITEREQELESDNSPSKSKSIDYSTPTS